MMNVKQNIYYKRLAKLALWPLVGFVGLVAVIVLSQVLVFYLNYVPGLLSLVGQSAPPETVALVASGVNKIIVNLSVWIVVLLMVDLSLLYVIWNVKKLITDLTP